MNNQILPKTVYNRMVRLATVVPPIDGGWNYDSLSKASYKASKNYTPLTAKYNFSRLGRFGSFFCSNLFWKEINS